MQGIASAALDISDGLISDLGHILKRSGLGAVIEVDKLPLSAELRQFEIEHDKALQLALSSGEEYELCFTVPEQNRGAIDTTLAHCGVKVTCIGQLRQGAGIKLIRDGQELNWLLHGYDHFAE